MKEIVATKGFSFFVDDDDFEKLNQFLWYTHNEKTLNFYSDLSGEKFEMAKTISKNLDDTFLDNKKRRYVISPAELIVDFDKNTHFISFANHKRNDFRKENLRVIPNKYIKLHRASPAKNAYMYRGVFKKRNKYAASINFYNEETGEREVIYRYGFDTIEDAALAYNELAREYYGEYAYFNIIGQDSRKPEYLTQEEIGVKRSSKAFNLEKGFTESRGRYYVNLDKRTIANTANKEDAIFIYNLAAKQKYGDKADINILSPEENEMEKAFFYTPFKDEKGVVYDSLWEACKNNQKDAVSLYQLVMRGEDILNAYTKAPVLSIEGPIRFNKYKYLHECWIGDVFEGFYETTEDAQYAYNQLVGENVYELEEGFIGRPMVVGKDATIVYEGKKYNSVNAFAKDVDIPPGLISGFIESSLPLEEIVKNHLNKRSSKDFYVDGVYFKNVTDFLRKKEVPYYRFKKVEKELIVNNRPHTPQDIYDELRGMILKTP